MKRYKLLKDLPNLKKGTILSEGKPIFGVRTLITKNNDVGSTFIGNELFEEFFEEIQEPTDSIHWKPKNGEKIWYLDENGNTNFTYFDEDNPYHLRRFEFGNTYRTSQECEKARDRKLAKARLRRTSTFKPDFRSGNGGWIVGYDYEEDGLLAMFIDFIDYGEVAHYKTSREAEKSIEENREDWLIYFGIEEEE